MPEDFDDDDDLDPDAPPPKTVTMPRAQIRVLEKKAATADQLQSELADLKREKAFRAAGLDPDDKKAAYFVKGYDGDLTADAIKDAATEAGFLEPPKPAEPPSHLQEDADALGRMEAAGAGGGVPPAGTEAVVEKLASGGLSEAEFWREAGAAGLT